MSKSIKGRKAYNNGVKVKYFSDDDIIPEGFVLGGLATRTHEEYKRDGKKSADTQKNSWEMKSEEDKKSWKIKCREAQLNISEEAKQRKIAKTIDTFNSKPQEEIDRINKQRGDCVIRALANSTGMSWMEVFDELVGYAREIQCMPNDVSVWSKFLLNHGYTYHGISNKKGTKSPTVYNFESKGKNVVAKVAHHLVYIKDGNYFDIWNCGRKCLYGYYEK